MPPAPPQISILQASLSLSPPTLFPKNRITETNTNTVNEKIGQVLHSLSLPPTLILGIVSEPSREDKRGKAPEKATKRLTDIQRHSPRIQRKIADLVTQGENHSL